jgi:type IV secretory pathway VirB2 component (pilin)
MKRRLIALAVTELVVIGTVWLFGPNPAWFAVVTMGVPILALTIALPIVLLIRSKQSSKSN